jgi:hypothetical protein
MNDNARVDRPFPRTLGWILALACALFVLQFALLGPLLETAGRARAGARTDATNGTAQTGVIDVAVTTADDPSWADAVVTTDQVRTRETTSAHVVATADQSRIRTVVEQQAAKVSTHAMTTTRTKLEALAHQVDASAATHGSAVVAARLAARFGMTVEEVLAEKAALGASWGQMMIAHALAAKASPVVGVAQLIAMHEDGMGWGKIAAGLGIKLGSAVSAVRAGAGAAQGLARADRSASVMRDHGAHVGVRGGMAAGLGMRHGGGMGIAAGAGARVGH